jgi:CheY-like chemotaxis protein
MAERTVLVVDDSGEDVNLIRVALQKAGFNNPVQAVCGSEEALQFLEGDGEYADRAKFPRPHLIILDHRMPGDALDVIRWVRRRPESIPLPIVVFTGSTNPTYEREAYEAGASAYHIKPQTFEEFVAVIKRIAEFWLMGGRWA